MSLDLQYGCVFCRTGKEIEIAKQLERRFPGLRAVAVEKLRYRRSQGVAHEEKVVLFPGYVFFSTPSEGNIRDIAYMENAIRLLTDGDGKWPLAETDRVIAQQFPSTGRLLDFRMTATKGTG